MDFEASLEFLSQQLLVEKNGTSGSKPKQNRKRKVPISGKPSPVDSNEKTTKKPNRAVKSKEDLDLEDDMYEYDSRMGLMADVIPKKDDPKLSKPEKITQSSLRKKALEKSSLLNDGNDEAKQQAAKEKEKRLARYDDGINSTNGGVYRSTPIGQALLNALKEMTELGLLSSSSSSGNDSQSASEIRKNVLSIFDECMESHIGLSSQVLKDDYVSTNSATNTSTSSRTTTKKVKSLPVPVLQGQVVEYNSFGGLWRILVQNATLDTNPSSQSKSKAKVDNDLGLVKLLFKARDINSSTKSKSKSKSKSKINSSEVTKKKNADVGVEEERGKK